MALKVFNDLAELGIPEVEALLKLARRLQTKPEPQALAGKVLALLFLSPSLRTLSSFQAAMIRLGGGSFVISPDMSIHGLETRSGIVMDGVAAEHLLSLGHRAIGVISGTNIQTATDFLETFEKCLADASIKEENRPWADGRFSDCLLYTSPSPRD